MSSPFEKRRFVFAIIPYFSRDVKKYFGDQVYDTLIPRNVRIPEAPSHGLPVMIYDYRSAGAQSYVRLAAEVLKREKEFLVNGKEYAFR